MSPPAVILIGMHGHGRVHLDDLLARDRAGSLTLRGVADLRESDVALPAQCVFDSDAERLLATSHPDIAVIATPIHTHASLAEQAMLAGAHVLLEKPPVTTLAEHDRLLDVATRTRRHCQVGFQALGSTVVRELITLVRDGGLGDVQRISVAGCWYRETSYYTRSAWAGQRALGDGALANPFAHGLALALRLAPDTTAVSVRAEPFHAYPIDTDDTMSARIDAGVPITVAVSLCAQQPFAPYVRVFGTEGQATVWYTEDRLRLVTGGKTTETTGRRVALVDDLIAHLAANPDEDVLSSPLRATRSFTSVLASIPEATAIPGQYQRITATGRTIPGIEDAVLTATEEGLLFSELGLPWAIKESR